MSPVQKNGDDFPHLLARGARGPKSKKAHECQHRHADSRAGGPVDICRPASQGHGKEEEKNTRNDVWGFDHRFGLFAMNSIKKRRSHQRFQAIESRRASIHALLQGHPLFNLPQGLAEKIHRAEVAGLERECDLT